MNTGWTRRPAFLLCALALGVVCFACATVPPLTESDLSRARAHYPDATLDQLSSGRRIYTHTCGACHYLYPPSRLTLAQWRDELVVMKARARISDTDAELVARFLSIGAKE